MVSKSWKAQTVSLPAENSCVPMVITAVYSPVKFWAQLFPLAAANDGMSVCGVCAHARVCVYVRARVYVCEVYVCACVKYMCVCR